MQQIQVSSGVGLSVLLPLVQRGSDQLTWQERAASLGDRELALATAAQPPGDGEYVRYHPAHALRYEAALLNPADPAAPAASDLTRMGVSADELGAESPAVARSLWILSYYADAAGQRLYSRNYLRLSGANALFPPAVAGGVWPSALELAYRQPAWEHAVLYAPAGITRCWLELRLAVARGGRQRVFTLNNDPTIAGLLELRVDPQTGRYAPLGTAATWQFTELKPILARNPLAPPLNDTAATRVVRYQTSAGGGYLPLKTEIGYAATSPL